MDDESMSNRNPWVGLPARCQVIVGNAKAFCVSAAGTTAIEYGLIIGGIVVAILAIVFNLGEDLEAYFNQVHAELLAMVALLVMAAQQATGDGQKEKATTASSGPTSPRLPASLISKMPPRRRAAAPQHKR